MKYLLGHTPIIKASMTMDMGVLASYSFGHTDTVKLTQRKKATISLLVIKFV